MDVFQLAIGYVISAFGKNKDAQKMGNDIFSAFVDWIRPVFLKDDETAKTVLEKEGMDDLKKEIIQKKLVAFWTDDEFKSQMEAWVKKLEDNKEREKHVLRRVEIDVTEDVEIGDKSPDTGQYTRKGVLEDTKIKAKNFRLGDG